MLGIRTDMKIAEHSRECGNVSKVLKGVIMILIKVPKAVFERYREDTLELTDAAAEISKKYRKDPEEIRKSIGQCMLPPQIEKLWGMVMHLRSSINTINTY